MLSAANAIKWEEIDPNDRPESMADEKSHVVYHRQSSILFTGRLLK